MFPRTKVACDRRRNPQTDPRATLLCVLRCGNVSSAKPSPHIRQSAACKRCRRSLRRNTAASARNKASGRGRCVCKARLPRVSGAQRRIRKRHRPRQRALGAQKPAQVLGQRLEHSRRRRLLQRLQLRRRSGSDSFCAGAAFAFSSDRSSCSDSWKALLLLLLLLPFCWRFRRFFGFFFARLSQSCNVRTRAAKRFDRCLHLICVSFS